MSAPTIRLARCAFHPHREASARCQGCGHSFCRECVTEAAGGMYCRRCLAARAAAPAAARGWAGWAAPGVWAAAGLALLFALFSLFLAVAASLPVHFLLAGGHGP